MNQAFTRLFFACALSVSLNATQAQVNIHRDVSLIFLQADTLNYLGFEFSAGKMYVLASHTGSIKKNYLLLFDEQAKLFSSVKLPVSYTHMRNSCNNKIFIGNNDSLAEVFFRGDTLALGYQISTPEFTSIMEKCFFMDDGVVFRQKYVAPTVSNRLYAVYTDEEGKMVESLVMESKDSLLLKNRQPKKRRAVDTYASAKRQSHDIPDARDMRGTRAGTQVDNQMAMYMYGYRRTGISVPGNDITPPKKYYPVQMLMNYHNENFYVLDYTNGNIAVINRFLNERKMINLEDFSTGIHLHDFTCDDATGDFYCFEGAGGHKPMRIYNHKTGKYFYSKPLPDLYQAENVRIYNQRLYYFIKADQNDVSNMIRVVDL